MGVQDFCCGHVNHKHIQYHDGCVRCGTARYKRKRRYHIRKYCHRCFGIGNNGRNADGNGFGSFIVQVTMSALAIIIFVIVYGRMIEIYLMVSLAPIPLSTFGNREQSNIGQNYLRSLFAIGFQGFLIMICVGIYAVLIQSIAFSDDIIGSIWGVMGYTVLLCFTLFKTGSLAKGVFSAH